MPKVFFHPSESVPLYNTRVERENGDVDFVTFDEAHDCQDVSDDCMKSLMSESKCFAAQKVAKPQKENKVALTPGDVTQKTEGDGDSKKTDPNAPPTPDPDAGKGAPPKP